MFKSIARVVFVLLISLGIIAAATSSNVQARVDNVLKKADANNTKAGISASDPSLGQAGGRERYAIQSGFAPGSFHECESDSSANY